MHWVFLTLITVILSCGCASNKDQSPADDPSTNRTAAVSPGKKTNPETPPKPKPQKTPRIGELTPVDVLKGRVASVNESLRFVVLDFLPGKMPKVDQRMNIYRQGQKVGEVKVTGPSRDTNIAADISSGEAKAGDEVRSE
jgi:hypothetical protein